MIIQNIRILMSVLLQKDLELERKIMQWMVNIVKEKPESPSQFDRWIQDGTVLSKLMIGIVFNSVPVETVHANWGSVSTTLPHTVDIHQSKNI